MVDGIPLVDPLGITISRNESPINPLVSINSNEIESIQILKDASSAAIYGARGTNGVVSDYNEIGQGQAKAKFSLNLAQGLSQATNKRNWLNTNQYRELFFESALNGGLAEEDMQEAEAPLISWQNTDWTTVMSIRIGQELAFQRISDRCGFSVSGADEKTRTFFGAYNNTDGIVRDNTLNG